MPKILFSVLSRLLKTLFFGIFRLRRIGQTWSGRTTELINTAASPGTRPEHPPQRPPPLQSAAPLSAGTLRHQLQNDRKSLLQAYQRKHGHRRSPKRNVTELIAIPCTDVFLFVVYLFRWLSMTLGVSILIHHSMECAWSWWMRKWCQMNTPSVVYMHDIIIVKIWGRRTTFF